MEFNSLFFIFIYLPLFIGLMYFVKNNNVRNGIVACFSLLFYFLGDKNHFFIIIFNIFITYLFGLLVNKNKRYYFVYLILEVSILCYFKYGSTIFQAFYKYNQTNNMLDIIMPLGISFYTFTGISYVSDIYYSKYNCENKLLNIVSYLTYFPVVISGPLIRYNTYKEFLDKKEINIDSIALGFRRFIIGLSKKVIIANQLSIITSTLFKDDMIISFFVSAYSLISYALQIYYDFSGYSDMAIGISQMIGYRIPENFNDPYFSHSISEFWRRWHISLSSWLRDYIYIPLGGNRKGTIRKYTNTIIVFLISGAWHGSTVNFVIWGLIHGMFTVFDSMFANVKKGFYNFMHIKEKSRLYNFIQIMLTNIVVLFSYIFFRSDNLIQVKNLISGLLLKGSLFNLAYIRQLNILHLSFVVLIAIILLFPNIKNGIKKLNEKIPLLYDLLLLICLIISIVIIISGSYTAFIYFQF